MSMTINGLGGGFAPDRNTLPKRKRQARSPPEGYRDRHLPEQDRVDDGWLPEQTRAEIAGFAQAIEAAETAEAMAAAAQEGLSGISQRLALMRKHALAPPPEAGGAEPAASAAATAAQACAEMERIVESVRFGHTSLLDGTLGTTGVAFGEGLEFISATAATRSSSPEGYPVWISRAPRRAAVELPLAISPRLLAQAPRLAIEADGRTAEYIPVPGDSLEEIAGHLRLRARERGLEILVEGTPRERLAIRHLRYGSIHGFVVKCSPPGVLAVPDGQPHIARAGVDVAGSIAGEPALGSGQFLTGSPGNRMTEGLTLRFSGALPEGGGNPARPDSLVRLRLAMEEDEGPEGHLVGRVILSQQPLVLRVGSTRHDAIAVHLNPMRPVNLGRGLETASGFRSVAEVKFGSRREREDAVRVIERGLEEVSEARAKLHHLTTHVLAEAVARLRVKAENQRALARSVPDAALAREVTAMLTSHMRQAGRQALQAQAQTPPGAMIRLLGGDEGGSKVPGAHG